MGKNNMAEHPSELKSVAAVATNLELPSKLRIDALEAIGRIGTHEALLALLDIAGNDKLIRQEREIAIKQAREIIKSGH